MWTGFRGRGFTLIELIVVVAIIALLASILLPSLAAARNRGRTVRCAANMRGMQMASVVYMENNDLRLFQAGLAHAGAAADESVAWINTLQPYYGNKLVARCPADFSVHWDGVPVPGVTPPTYRRTSYGINDFLDVALCPYPMGGYPKLGRVPRASATVQFVEMAQEGSFAGADHPHVENWVANPPVIAASQLQTDVHGGTTKTNSAKANYGFLDGHAETLTFGNVYQSVKTNSFDPAVAR